VDQGGRENLNFKFRFTFFLFLSYISSSFLFFFVGAKLASKEILAREKNMIFCCFGSLLDKLLYKNGTKKCSRVVGRKG
jgi:hypothetical protein